MNEQAIPKIKKNLLLDWIYKQKNNVPVNDLLEFIKTNTEPSKIVTTDQKNKIHQF